MTTTTTTIGAEERRAARAAKAEAERARRAGLEAERAELLAGAVRLLLDHDAFVPEDGSFGPSGRVGRALAIAVRLAAIDADLAGAGARVAAVLDGAAVRLRSQAWAPTSRTWARQHERFLRGPDELQVGSYTYGLKNKPASAVHYYVLAVVERGGPAVIAETRTAAEIAGADAAARVERAWTEIERLADEAGADEAGAGEAGA